MQTHVDITAERHRRYEQLSKAAPLLLVVMLSVAVAGVLLSPPSLAFVLFNAFVGVAIFLAWSFALRQRERAALAAVLVALGAFGAAVVSAGAPLSWHAVAVGLATSSAVFAACLTGARFAPRG